MGVWPVIVLAKVSQLRQMACCPVTCVGTCPQCQSLAPPHLPPFSPIFPWPHLENAPHHEVSDTNTISQFLLEIDKILGGSVCSAARIWMLSYYGGPEVQIHPLYGYIPSLHDPQFLHSTVTFVHSTAKFLHSTPPDSFTPLQNTNTSIGITREWNNISRERNIISRERNNILMYFT